jgi:glycosyltransferase involved in cell wall biosynthesis
MARPLHVVHGVLSLDVGGLERCVLSLVTAGRKAGQRVTVACVERPGTLAPAVEAAGGAVVSLGKPPGRHPQVIDAARTLLAGLAPDVVHTHQLGALVYLGPAAGVPVLHTEHGNQFARDGFMDRLKGRLLWRRTAGLAGLVCCVSAEIAAALGRWRTVHRDKLEVVSNGVDVDALAGGDGSRARAELGIPADAPVVGTVGRLAEVKRQDLLLRAAAGLAKRWPALRVLLVGDGPERGRLEGLANELGVAAHFAGYQSDPANYLAAMDVFALTSRSEGQPVALLEAWAAGRPVVATAVGGVPAVVADGDTGLLVPSGDAGAVAAAVGRLLADRSLAATLADRGRAAAGERYSLAGMAAGYEARYRRLIAARAGVG